MHFVCCCSLPVWRRNSLKKGTVRDLVLPRTGSTPRQILPKNNNTLKGPWQLHPYKSSLKASSSSGEEHENAKYLETDDERTDDGRRTDERATRYDHSSLEPAASVSSKPIDILKTSWNTFITNDWDRLTFKMVRKSNNSYSKGVVKPVHG